MHPDPRLHHYCQNVVRGTLADVVEMYGMLGFRIVFEPPGDAGWIMVGQDALRFAIQVAEVDEEPVADIGEKIRTHVGLISDRPAEVIDGVERWAKEKGLRFRRGGWSERELYFDLPDVFVDFVVEVMHASIEEG